MHRQGGGSLAGRRTGHNRRPGTERRGSRPRGIPRADDRRSRRFRQRAGTEEIFGPVLTAVTFSDEEEAITLANAGRYGLTAAVWTADIDRAFRVADRIEAGYLWINDVETRFPAVPFGGWKDSGIGQEHGLAEILSFTRVKAVNVRLR